MDQLKQAAPHLLIAGAVIGASVALAVTHAIDGATAVALIASAGGVSLGGAVGSSFSGTGTPATAGPAVAIPAAVTSPSVSNVTPAPSTVHVIVPPAAGAEVTSPSPGTAL